MDVHVHVTVLRLHSEYLAQLFTEVSAQLSTLEQTLSEHSPPAAVRDASLLTEVANLQRRLCVEGEMFCHRLQRFLEGAKNEQQPAAAAAVSPQRNKKAGLGNLHD